MLKYIFSGILCFLLSGCDLGLDDSKQVDAENDKKRGRLLALGEKIKGTYRGNLKHIDGKEYPMEIRLFYPMARRFD